MSFIQNHGSQLLTALGGVMVIAGTVWAYLDNFKKDKKIETQGVKIEQITSDIDNKTTELGLKSSENERLNNEIKIKSDENNDLIKLNNKLVSRTVDLADKIGKIQSGGNTYVRFHITYTDNPNRAYISCHLESPEEVFDLKDVNFIITDVVYTDYENHTGTPFVLDETMKNNVEINSNSLLSLNLDYLNKFNVYEIGFIDGKYLSDNRIEVNFIVNSSNGKTFQSFIHDDYKLGGEEESTIKALWGYVDIPKGKNGERWLRGQNPLLNIGEPDGDH